MSEAECKTEFYWWILVSFYGIKCDTSHTELHGIEYLIIEENMRNILNREKTGWKIIYVCVHKYTHIYNTGNHI